MEDVQTSQYVLERHIAATLLRNIMGDTQVPSEEAAKLRVVETSEP
jgi:hypothetical protein